MQEEHKAIAGEGVELLKNAQNKFLSAGHPGFGGILSVIEAALTVAQAVVGAVK